MQDTSAGLGLSPEPSGQRKHTIGSNPAPESGPCEGSDSSGSPFELSSPSPPCGLVELSGYSCASNSASFAVNQQYQQEGSTADGRPYFHGVQDEAVYLYYTTMCGGISGIDGWGVFDSAPSLDATSNVNAGSGGCSAATFLIWPGANFPQASTMGWYTYCRPPSETWSSSWYVQQDHFVATLSVCL